MFILILMSCPCPCCSTTVLAMLATCRLQTPQCFRKAEQLCCLCNSLPHAGGARLNTTAQSPHQLAPMQALGRPVYLHIHTHSHRVTTRVEPAGEPRERRAPVAEPAGIALRVAADALTARTAAPVAKCADFAALGRESSRPEQWPFAAQQPPADRTSIAHAAAAWAPDGRVSGEQTCPHTIASSSQCSGHIHSKYPPALERSGRRPVQSAETQMSHSTGW